MNPGIYVNQSLRVYWVDDDEWYSGVIDDYQPQLGWHVQYQDGEAEWLRSLKENVAFDDPTLFEQGESKNQNGDTLLSNISNNTTDLSELEIVIDSQPSADVYAHTNNNRNNNDNSSNDNNNNNKKNSNNSAENTNNNRNNNIKSNNNSNNNDSSGNMNNNNSNDNITTNNRNIKEMDIDNNINPENRQNNKNISSISNLNSEDKNYQDNNQIDKENNSYNKSHDNDNRGVNREPSEIYRRRDYKEETQGENLYSNENKNILKSSPLKKINRENGINGMKKIIVPPKGFLLVGVVIGASNLPPVDQNETDGRCFFRVLHVEGSGQSTMFRCKTPIYSSETTDDLYFPQWREGLGTFRFEMIMPEEVNSKKTSSGIEFQGQILIAMYRARANGGYSFLGQVTFDLTDLAQNGIKDPHQADVEARSLSGAYPLIDRFDKVIGNYAEVDVNIQLAWMPDSFKPNEPNESTVIDSRNENGNPTRPYSSSSASMQSNTPRPSGGSVGGSVKPTSVSGRPRTATSTAKSNANGNAGGASMMKAPAKTTTPAPIKLVSAQSRKQTEDRRRIEMQNKSLHSKLQSHGPRGKGAVGAVYSQPQSNIAENKQESSSSASVAGAKRGGQSVKEIDASLEDVLAFWRRLKKEVSDREDQNISLKAILSKLKTHSKKYENTNDRLRKQVNKNISTASEPKYDNDRRNEYMSKDSKDQRPQFTAAEEEKYQQEDLESITDNELRELIIENNSLQQLRRSLLDRARNAKAFCNDHISLGNDAQDSQVSLMRRMALINPSYFSNINNTSNSTSNNASNNASNNCNNNNDNNSSSNRSSGTNKNSVAGGGTIEFTAAEQDLKDCTDRLSNVQLDYLCAESARDHDFHIGPLADEIAENQEVVTALQKIVKNLDVEIGIYSQEKDIAKVKLDRLVEEGRVYKLRDSIAELRLVMLKIQKKQRLEVFEKGSEYIEKELIRLNV